jgi:pyruvate dehydrogenase E1 component beta subunit
MPVEVLMPALSPTMTEGKLARWLKSEGDRITSGDVLAEIETDKATMELESVNDGVLGRILVPAGSESIAVNRPIAIILESGEESSAIRVPSMEPQAAPPPVAPSSPPPARPAPAAAPSVAAPTAVPAVIDETWTGPTVTMTVREALRDAMAEEMRRDDNVFLMGEEVAQYQGAYKVSQGLLEEFGERRIVDTPITEMGFTGLGVGAAIMGLRPVVEYMTFNFAMQAIDQIVNSAAKTHYMSGGQIHCPIVFRGPNGAAARVAAQHSQEFASWYAHIPGLKVVAPYSAADAKGLLKSAIRDPNPVIFLEHEILYGQSFPVPDHPDWLVPIGKARVVQPGKDVTIVAFSRMVGLALEAAKLLEAEDIDAEIIDLRTLRPLDHTTIVQSVKKTNRLVTIEEGWPAAGIGSELAALMMEHAFDYLDAPVTRVTGADVPMPYAANLEKFALPQIEHIVAAAKAVCYRR